MLCYISFDGDGIGKMVGRARLADNVEEVRRVNQRIDSGNEIWKSWALRVGGSIIEIAGDEGAIMVPADKLDELPALAEQYGGAVEATVSVGVGMKLSESAKALLYAKLTGKNKICFYTQDMEKTIKEAQEHKGSEADKIVEEYLDKAAPAMNAGAFSGASRPSGATTQKPVATQGDHEEGQAIQDVINDENAPAPVEATHAASDFERQLHEEAWKGEQEDMHVEAQKSGKIDQIKSQVAQALQALKAQAPMLEQLRQASPQAYQAMMALSQSVIAMAREIAPTQPQAQPMAKKEDQRVTVKKNPKRADESDMYRYMQSIHTGAGSDLNKIPMEGSFRLVDVPLNRLPALRPADNSHVVTYSKLKTPFPPIIMGYGGSIPDGHHRIAAARLRGDQSIRAYIPHEEVEAWVGKQMKKSEFVEGNYPEHADDSEILTYFMTVHTGSRADFKRIPYDTEYELKELSVAGLVSGVRPDNAVAAGYAKRETPFPPIIMKTEGAQPLDGNHRVIAARIRGDETIRAYVPLAKAKEPDSWTDEQGHERGVCATCGVEVSTHPAAGHSFGRCGNCNNVTCQDHREGKGDICPACSSLDKGGLPMPGASAHHHTILPVGSQVDQKVKVQHSDGKTSWRQMEAGQIRSQDPSGHPTSSRSPNAK
jgi:hypothetical protein